MTKQNHAQLPDQGIETRVALLEMCVSNINKTMERMEAKIDMHHRDNYSYIERLEDTMDKGFSDARAEMLDMRKDINEIRKEMKSDFRWLLTIIAALGGIMAHGFHWF